VDKGYFRFCVRLVQAAFEISSFSPFSTDLTYRQSLLSHMDPETPQQRSVSTVIMTFQDGASSASHSHREENRKDNDKAARSKHIQIMDLVTGSEVCIKYSSS
jgi:hypothetical protein